MRLLLSEDSPSISRADIRDFERTLLALSVSCKSNFDIHNYLDGKGGYEFTLSCWAFFSGYVSWV